MTDFALIPFPSDTIPSLSINGQIERQDNQLTLEYKLEPTSEITIPKPAASPSRQFDLWEHTCCEFFLGLKDSTQYWEFNLSPARHWNVFRFLDYRQNIAEEYAFDTLPFQVTRDDLRIDLEVDLNQIIEPDRDLEIGITAVIEDRSSRLSYWALSHPGKEADFHLRSSFAIAL